MPSEDTDSSSSEAAAPQHAKAKAWLAVGGSVLAVASVKVLTRMAAWGSLGLGLGVATWCGLYFGGLLESDWSPWATLVWVLAALYALGGAAALGYCGFLRGIGRTVLYVGIERGFVMYLTEGLLSRTKQLMEKSDRAATALDRADRALQNVPLQQWEDRLKEATRSLLGDDDSRGAVSGYLRRFICEQLETFLLSIVRQEVSESGGGGVSMQKVRALALEQVENFFADFVEGMMNNYLFITLAIMALAYAIAPTALALI